MKRCFRLVTAFAFLVAVMAVSCGTPDQNADLDSMAFPLASGLTKSLVTSGLGNATAMAFAPDGRVFVAQRGTTNSGGTASASVRIVKNGSLLSTPFVRITVDNTSFGCCNERGLVGIAIDPDFDSNHFVYVYYTVPGSPTYNRLSRFTANGDVAVAGSEMTLLNLENNTHPNHNGGALHFGLDGKLYVAVGNDVVNSNSQSIGNRRGKILRINSDGTIPADNPTSFPGIAGTTTGMNRAIWAVGFRNPFTAAIHPTTGRLFVNDVGEATREEVDDVMKGKNYGWPSQEGFNGAANANFTRPVIDYGHGDQGACAITGGTFYHPPTNTLGPQYFDKYFFADFCGGWVRMLDPSTRAVSTFDTGYGNPVDIRVGTDNALYVLARGSGQLWRIQGTTMPTQDIAVSTTTMIVPEASSGTFTVKLASQPSSNVVVNVARTSGVSTVTASTASLTFTSANWNTAQTVTVAAADDTVVGNVSATITCSSTGLTSKSVNVTVADNDSAAFAPTAQISLPHNGDVVLGTVAEFFGQGIPGGSRVIAINAGGPANGAYLADVDFMGGMVSNGTTTAINTSAVPNPAPMGVYQSGRFGNFSYVVPNLAAGQSHSVRLHFAEYFFTSAGQRVFGASVNGSQVLSNFDIFAAAGGRFRAVVREAATTADANGRITTSFTSSVNNALLQGLEVFRGGATVVKAEFYIDGVLKSTDVTNSPPDHYHYLGNHSSWDTTTLPNGSHTLKMVVYDMVGASGSDEITVTVNN